MAKLENYEKTATVALKVGVTAGVMVVGAEVILNRTGLSAPAKAASVAGVGIVGGLALAGHAPHIAAGMMVGSIVYVAQTASRATKLEQRVDALLSQKRTEAETAARQSVQQQLQQATPTPAPTPQQPAATPAPTPAPAQGLPAGMQSVRFVNARGPVVSVGRAA